MVLINLSKFLQLLVAIQACPCSIPKRLDILFDQYIKFKATSDHVISIAVSTSLERFKEENVDDAEDSKKKKIVREIIRYMKIINLHMQLKRFGLNPLTYSFERSS